MMGIMNEFTVNLGQVTSWTDFIDAFNRDFIRPVCGSDWDWNGNLDAFNDVLWWPDPHPYSLVLVGWKSCFTVVNQHRAPDGRPVLEVIDEIFRDNRHVTITRA
jgi:hypothetical protein